MTMLEKKKNNLAKILTLIAIFLILVYGLDAALDRSDTGFLPLDSKNQRFCFGITKCYSSSNCIWDYLQNPFNVSWVIAHN